MINYIISNGNNLVIRHSNKNNLNNSTLTNTIGYINGNKSIFN